MDTIREQLNRPIIAAVVGLVVGLFLGWFLLGWGLFPVSWTDGTPKDLRSDLQEDYLRSAIEAYTKTMDPAQAVLRYEALEDEADEVLQRVTLDPRNLSPVDVALFTSAVQGQAALPVEPVPTTQPGTPEAGGILATSTPATEAGTAEKPSSLPLIIGVICALTLIIAAGGAYLFIIRGRNISPSSSRVSSPAASVHPDVTRPVESKEYDLQGQEAPVAQFMTTFMAGDDLYDDSFSIDSPSGEFLGECGVGISDTIGVGDPKKVTAFEVWLFDKNDIQTVTKVLMSEHAFNDPTINQRLESKGEPVLAEPGKRILLETATLQLEARVVDMNYGQGALPANSFFDRLTLELAIWPKPAQA
jgi:hypothetical protein